jgi:hypothetical protein
MTKPGTRVDLDVEYPGPRGRIHPAQPPPIAQLIKRKPWLLWRLVSGRLPHGA